MVFGRDNVLVLKEFKDENYSIKALYKILDQTWSSTFPFRLTQNSCVPPKVGFFSWKLLLGVGF